MKKLHSPLAVTVFMTVAALGLLSACGGDDGKKAPSQVVARVNGKEITVHQLNLLLQRQPNADNQVKQKALDSLVDQEILVQKAEELKLDREPGVVQVIEQAKREILARAALDRLSSKTSEITPQAVDEFYAKNPAMFAERKIYQLDTFVIEKAAYNEELRTVLDASKSAAETQEILQSKQIKFNRRDGKLAAEQVPMALLGQVAAMKPGDILIQPDKDWVRLLQLRDTIPAPVDKEKATPVIKQMLANKQKAESMQANIKSLHSAAKIEYVQKFDESAPKPAAQPEAATDKPAGNPDDLNEGLKGLK